MKLNCKINNIQDRFRRLENSKVIRFEDQVFSSMVSFDCAFKEILKREQITIEELKVILGALQVHVNCINSFKGKEKCHTKDLMNKTES